MIRVEINTRTANGHLRKEIELTTNDPANPSVRLVVTAGINESLRITPKYIDFGNMKKGTAKSAEFVVENLGKADMNIVFETAPKESLTVRPSSGTIKAGASMKCTVRLVGTFSGHVEGMIYAKTGGPDYMVIPILAQAEIMEVGIK